MNKVILKPGRERSVKLRHPWLFSGAIAEGGDQTGEVEVYSSREEFLSRGFCSAASQIRVRLEPAASVRDRVFAAVGRRAAFWAEAYTNALRLINAESDSLPGVVADLYDGFVVLQLTSAGAEAKRDELVTSLMSSVPGCRGISERLDLSDRQKEGLATEPIWRNLAGVETPETIEIVEGECRFLVDVRRGHKTGFYLDQRDARALVGKLANGLEVLNCFAYTGGFGLFARAGGATKVTQVDISADAIAMAKKNEHLGHFCGTKMEYVEADVFDYLRKCRDAGTRFDMIVLDPPKFAAVKSQVMKAARGYKDINLLAMKLLRKDGYLATFSCSGAMTTDLFDKVVAEAAVDAGRSFQIVARTRQGADHPVALSFPEGAYLKGLILRALD